MLGKLSKEERGRGCRYGGCGSGVDVLLDYCDVHFKAFGRGEVDECFECGAGKLRGNDLCDACFDRKYGHLGYKNGVAKNGSGKGKGNVKVSVSGVRGSTEAGAMVSVKEVMSGQVPLGLGDGFYVYLLALKGEGWYASYTGDIGMRLMEHRTGAVRVTRQRKPKLVWFSMVPTEAQAVALEAQLRLVIRGKCGHDLAKWASQFLEAVSNVDLSWRV